MDRSFLKRSRVFVAILVCLSIGVGAFVSLPQKAAGAGDVPSTLRVAILQDIPDFNIWNLASNSNWKADVFQFAFEGLAGIDQDMKPYPLLAESWEFDESTLQVIIHLRQGVTFHDGVVMTADDVVFTYMSVREGTIYSSNIVNAFDSNYDGVADLSEMQNAIVKVDDATVRMTMANPYGQFFSVTLNVPIIPKHIWENHLDYYGLVDVLWNSPDAVVGTGPFKYAGGLQDSYRLLERYAEYWGKDFVTPAGSRIYPVNVNMIRFVVVGTSDSAVASLRGASVDCVPFSIPANYLPALESDPQIGLSFMSDNGYYYLAFNEKLNPMGNLSFRKAVSALTDKDRIVDVYMGGLGIKGSSCEPPFWGDWFNASVITYPYDATLATSRNLLDSAGFVDVNGDGWRELPDGSQMERITILTPPADYDPIRINAGLMIADEMRQVGIDSIALPIDFDTLVSRLQSMDYQMLIIGWSLASDPVGNVFDILGPKASTNTFGFWSLDDPNPFYFELGGVNTRADAETQRLAEEVSRLEGLAKGSFSVADQMIYTKWAEGIIGEALPVDVLYYRTNAEAYSVAWAGWIPFDGTLLNVFSLANLSFSGGGISFSEATMGVNAGLTLPGKVYVGGEVEGYVLAIDKLGAPVAGASVVLTIESLGQMATPVAASPGSGTTDAAGLFKFTVMGLSPGYSGVTVTVSKNGEISTDHSAIDSVTPLPTVLHVSITPDMGVLLPGQSTSVSISVTDESGLPVEGAMVTVDPGLMGYGSVDKEAVVTDAAGAAVVVYSAPSAIDDSNAHLMVTLSFSVSKAGYYWSNIASEVLLILNTAPSDWTMIVVDSVTSTALSQQANTTTIKVRAVDENGLPIGGKSLAIDYSDESIVFNPVRSAFTDPAGLAQVDVQLKDAADPAALRVSVADRTVLSCSPAAVTLTYVGSYPPEQPMYGGYMTYSAPAPFMLPVGSLDVTAFIWDDNGVPVDGVDASLIVSGAPYGSLTWCDQVNWDSTFDGWGINVITSRDKQNIVTSGPFNTPYDYTNWEMNYNNGYIFWDWGMMTGVPITGGIVSFTIYGADVAPADVLSHLFVVPNGMGWFNPSTLSYEIDGQTLVSGDCVLGRSYHVVWSTFTIDKPTMMAKTSAYDSTPVNVWVKDETGAPVENADVLVYQNVIRGNLDYLIDPSTSPLMRMSAPVPTDSSGYASVQLIAVGRNFQATSVSIVPVVYVRAGMFGSISLLDRTDVMIFTQQCMLDPIPIYDVKGLGSNIAVSATVTDSNGLSVPGLKVVLASGAGYVPDPENITDENGMVSFQVDTTVMDSTKTGFIGVQMRTEGAAFDVCVARMMIAVKPVALPAEVVSKLRGNPKLSIVTWQLQASTGGTWKASIENHGLKTLELKIIDVTNGTATPVFVAKLKLSSLDAYPSGTVTTAAFPIQAGHVYMFSAAPSGQSGDYAIIQPVFSAGSG